VIENLSIAIQALGWLGLFLLVMIIITEGLREMAGDAIRGLDRVSHQIVRISLHSQQARLVSGQ
jgi:hypothetical protein